MEMTGVLSNDLIGVALEALLPLFGDYVSIAKKMLRDRKEQKDLFKIVNRAKLSGGLSETMYNKLSDESRGIILIEFDLISTALRTNKWINYAIWCMTDMENPGVVLLKANENERKLVNSVALMCGFGKIFESAGFLDLNEYAIENEDRETGTEFLLSIEDLKEKASNPRFIKAMRMKKAKLDAEAAREIPMQPNFFGNARIDQDGLVHPIFFSNVPVLNSVGPKQGNGISDELFARLENVVTPHIKDQEYSYNIDVNSGLPMLTIMRDNTSGAIESYILDDGTIMGGTSISILGKYLTKTGSLDYIFVDVAKLPEIAHKIINISFYELNPEEVYNAFSIMLQNYSIYNAIDFSNTYWFDYLNAGEKKILTDHLTNIVSFMNEDQNLYYLPRLRFSEYTNPNNFTLVSDNKVKSPLSSSGFTSPEICEGLSFVCKDGTITQYFANHPNATTNGALYV